MREAPDGNEKLLTLLAMMALSTVIVVVGLLTKATHLSYPGLALWFIALASTAVWLVWRSRP